MTRVPRLKKRKEFVHVARKGRKWAVPGLVLQSFDRQNDPENAPIGARVGFTVTKKIGTAVKRNRVRRRLKAAAAAVMPSNAEKNTDYVLIGRAGTLKRPFEFLVEDLKVAMQKLGA
tara:strand:- start:303 stop:653 length:351 start_codon:yes stop_codon:yes gene_type:complete